MFAKIKVTGTDKHPLYKALIEAQPESLVGRGSQQRNSLEL